MLVRSTALVAAAGLMLLGGAAAASADSGAGSAAVKSPGVLSGNVIQIPVHISLNICGDTVSVVGLLNPAFATICANGVHSSGK
ncbi:chaplin [Streptomyces collinus]|uniref:chaplin n=1 Tax=Streptomyces collinus TaxID=42684 RepID=UPI003694DE51